MAGIPTPASDRADPAALRIPHQMKMRTNELVPVTSPLSRHQGLLHAMERSSDVECCGGTVAERPHAARRQEDLSV
jgi:hypothetical protein